MIKAVIFDMYETLITYYGAPVYFGTQMAEDAGVPVEVFLPRWRSTEEGRTLGKWRIEEVLEEILRENNCYSEDVLNLMMKKRMAAQVECFDHLHPEILKMLRELKEKDIRVGLVTNCFWEEAESIQNSVLYPYFDAACFSCEEGLQKPDEKIFRKCMDILGVTAKECLYVGDGGSMELETAKKIGMNAVQAVWYLKEGSAQTWSRKEDFTQVERPVDVIALKCGF